MDSIGRDLNLLELNLEIPIPGSVLESETVSNVTVRCFLPDTGTSGIWDPSFPVACCRVQEIPERYRTSSP